MAKHTKGPNRASAMKVLNRFERACLEQAWKGAGDPDDFETIEDEYNAAKLAITKVMAALTEPKKKEQK